MGIELTYIHIVTPLKTSFKQVRCCSHRSELKLCPDFCVQAKLSTSLSNAVQSFKMQAKDPFFCHKIGIFKTEIKMLRTSSCP